VHPKDCQPCHLLLPFYEEAATKLSAAGSMTKVAYFTIEEDSDFRMAFRLRSLPGMLYFGSDEAWPVRLDGPPKSGKALLAWMARLAESAVTEVTSEAQVLQPVQGSLPVVVLKAPALRKAFSACAKQNRQRAHWFWLREPEGTASLQVRHWQEAPANLSLDGEVANWRWEEFFKLHAHPLVQRVDDPAAFVKDRMQKVRQGVEDITGVVWLLLSGQGAVEAAKGGATQDSCPSTPPSSGGGRPGGCSASGGDGAAGTSLVLDDLVREWYPLAVEAAGNLLDSTKKRYSVAYVDGDRWADWAEKELSAWDFPKIVVQRQLGVGDSYFFDLGSRMPEDARQLTTFVQEVDSGLNFMPRRRSQRPRKEVPGEATQHWKLYVGDNLEDGLRAAPATLLYVLKGAPSFAVEEEQAATMDEVDSLHDLSDWIHQACQPAPLPVAMIDVRENDIPLDLYLSADFTMPSLPAVFFIRSDKGNSSAGKSWRGKVERYGSSDRPPPPGRTTASASRLLSVDSAGVAAWALQLARGVEGITAPPKEVEYQGPDASKGDNLVQELLPRDFERFLHGTPLALVNFYAPWCGHCEKFAPTFEAVAMKARKMQPPLSTMVFAKIDGSEAKAAVYQYNVHAYPTLMLLRAGQKADKYTGGKRRKDILDWLELMTRSSIAEVDDSAGAMPSNGRPSVLWRGPTHRGHVLLGEAAEAWRHAADFFVLAGPGPGALELRLPGAPKQPLTYNDALEASALQRWLKVELAKSEPEPEEQEASVLKVVGRSFRRIVLGSEKHVLVYVHAPWCEPCKAFLPDYEKFAVRMEDEGRNILVTELDGTQNDVPYKGWEWTDYPTLFHLQPLASRPIEVKKQTLDDLLRYVSGLGINRADPKRASAKKQSSASKPAKKQSSASKLLEGFKSQPVPEKQEGALREVVLRSFDQEVFRDRDIAVLEVYAPWCGHCKQLAKPYSEFAQQMLQERKDVVVGRMDGTQNDLPFDGFEVKGFPTIFIVLPGAKTPAKTFVGSQALDQTKAWLKSRGR